MPHPRTRRAFLTTVTGVGALAATGLTLSTGPAAHASSRYRKKNIASLDVISDVQGDLSDFADALAHLDGLGTADALIVNGDLVANGYERQYDEYYGTLNDNPHPDTVVSVFGNHEQYNNDPFDTQVDRFLRHTGMPDVYTKQEVAGVPLLTIGTTAPSVNGTNGPFVTLGSAQLSWLESELASYADSGRPVLIFSHHVLPGTVSGTTGDDAADFYDQDFVDETELLTILGRHSNVVFFSGHTHWNLRRDDWAARKIVDGGDPDGFTVVNTGFVQTLYGPDGTGGETPIDAAASQGLRVDIADDGALTIGARDFRSDEHIKSLEVPAPG